MSGVTTLGLDQEGTTGGDQNFRLDVGSVLARTFGAWAANLVPFFVVGFVAYIPVLLLIGLLGATQSFSAGTNSVVNFGTSLFTLILTGAVTYGVFRHLHGERAHTGEVLRTGLSQFGSVFVTGLFVGISALIGFCLLIIPGFVLLVRYWVAVPVAVIESPGAWASLRRSEDLTDGNRWHVFAIAIIMGFIVIAGSVLLLVIGVMLAAGGGGASAKPAAESFGALARAVVIILSIPINCLAAVAPVVVYHDLRIGKEGADIEELLKVFE